MALIDLTQEIYQGMNVYPGHLKTVIWEHASHAETAKTSRAASRSAPTAC
jgi:hypothetical protein